jgi:ArsR family transcriptional regulator
LDVCSSNNVHWDTVNKVKTKLENEDVLSALGEFFKIFGDLTRLKIIDALSNSEMCVCDLVALLNMKQSRISHQLKNLRQHNVVKNRREGRNVYYSLNDEHVETIFEIGIVHLKEKFNKFI